MRRGALLKKSQREFSGVWGFSNFTLHSERGDTMRACFSAARN
jgi:hypothetical protein